MKKIIVAFVAVLLVSAAGVPGNVSFGFNPQPDPPGRELNTLLRGPQNPCIATGTLFAAPDISMICYVRNIGTAAHNVTVELRDFSNHTLMAPFSTQLVPGDNTLQETVSGVREAVCVVTTDDGTTASLKDLDVTMQALDTSIHGTGSTDGHLFNNCVLASTSPLS